MSHQERISLLLLESFFFAALDAVGLDVAVVFPSVRRAELGEKRRPNKSLDIRLD